MGWGGGRCLKELSSAELDTGSLSEAVLKGLFNNCEMLGKFLSIYYIFLKVKKKKEVVCLIHSNHC